MKSIGLVAAFLVFGPAVALGCGSATLSVGTEMEGGSTGDDGAPPPPPGMDAQPGGDATTPPPTDAQAQDVALDDAPAPPFMDVQGPPMTDAQGPPATDAQGSCTQVSDCPSAAFSCVFPLPAFPTPTGCSELGQCMVLGVGPVCNVLIGACGCDGKPMGVPGCGEQYVPTRFAYYGNCEGGM